MERKNSIFSCPSYLCEMRQFAISDIHGCNVTFKALLDKIGLTSADELYLLGDYIDRGPDSKGVLDTIIDLQSTGYKVRCLMGNHEDAMNRSLYDFEHLEAWLVKWGGRETLQSFDAFSINEVPLEYWQWLDSLEKYIEVDDYLLVHAGLNWSAVNPLADVDGLIFARNWYHKIDYEWLRKRTIVHGHTPVVRTEMETMLKLMPSRQYLDIDNGCVYDRYGDGAHNLCAFDMTNRTLFFQKNLDDVSGYWEGK
ncbi:MAG: serine/threonine protein phosphatase [Bacteroidetes bacterium]|nr:serine/threonine protein phosphatase [Bacteroidota bacterium]